MWAAYFHYVAAEGRRLDCRFLIEWASFEVTLRNALVHRRAQLLELDPTSYLVDRDIEIEETVVEPVVNAWASAEDALAAQQALDRARLRWCEDHDRYFSFGIDEVASYARRLMLVSRWHEMATDKETASTEQE
jgi:hypothetical protein